MDKVAQLVWLYCEIDDAVRSIVGSGRLRARGPCAKLTDAEALAIVIWAEMQGLHEDASIWRYARSHLLCYFPSLGSEWNFSRQCSNLLWLKDRMLCLLFGPTSDWNAFDGFPVPVCKLARASRDRRFKGEAAWSFCAAKNEKYYGFKAGAFMNSDGEIFRCWLGPANVDERTMVQEAHLGDLESLLLADKGLVSKVLSAEVAAEGSLLVTPLRKNMEDIRPPSLVKRAMRLRRRIETALGELVRLGAERCGGRDFRRLCSRFLRKVLAYNLSLRMGKAALSA